MYEYPPITEQLQHSNIKHGTLLSVHGVVPQNSQAMLARKGQKELFPGPSFAKNRAHFGFQVMSKSKVCPCRGLSRDMGSAGPAW
jgi:hypothetical protein